MTDTPPAHLTPADSFAFRNAADAQIAPDGSRICFLLTRRDLATDSKRTVLMVSTDRRNFSEVPDSEGCLLAHWSPDSRRLAMLRRAGAKTTLEIRNPDTGAAKILVQCDTALRELAWSPDGTRIAFQQRIDAPSPDWLDLATPPPGAAWSAAKITERLVYRHDVAGEIPEGSFQIFVTAADASTPPRPLTSGIWWNGMPHLVSPGLTWTPDGNDLLVTGTRNPEWDREPSKLDLHAIAVADGTVRQITRHAGVVGRPSPSPSGRWIAYTVADDTTNSYRPRRLMVMPAAGGPARALLPGFDHSIDEIAWSADSSSVFFTYDAPGQRRIARGTLAGEISPVANDVGATSIEMPYSGGGFSLASDGTAAYVRSSHTVPSEIAIAPPSGVPQTLTALNAELAQRVGGFVDAEMFWIDGAEGRRVQCWLIAPRGRGPHPLILEIHGGPFAQYGDRFSMKFQMLVAAGYAVLAVNPCGSTGYGEAFANALHDRFPGPDYDDLMAAVDVAVARPDIDANNLFVTGVSGGGVLSAWTVAHTNRFRAAVSIKPVVSWESWMLTADMGPSGGRVWMGGDLPWENPEKFRARSPLSHVGKVRTPTMLMAGETDSRTPISEAMQMYAALKLAGVDSALVRLPGTSHGSAAMRPSLFAAEVACILGWFGRYRR